MQARNSPKLCFESDEIGGDGATSVTQASRSAIEHGRAADCAVSQAAMEAFLDSQRDAYPDLAERYTEFGELYRRKCVPAAHLVEISAVLVVAGAATRCSSRRVWPAPVSGAVAGEFLGFDGRFRGEMRAMNLMLSVACCGVAAFVGMCRLWHQLSEKLVAFTSTPDCARGDNIRQVRSGCPLWPVWERCRLPCDWLCLVLLV